MTFWWANQGDNYSKESAEGYLWAPRATTTGRSRPDWRNMALLRPNDIVFNYSQKVLRGFCVVTSEATPWPTPYPDGYGDAREGTLALAQYEDAMLALSYARIVGEPPAGLGISLAGATPKLGLPDKPAQGYLYALPDAAGQALWKAVGKTGFVPPDPLMPTVPSGGTSKLRLATARVGQGEFGRGVREAFSYQCGVTGLKRREPFILHAAHIKPWANSSDQERLDPANGILLHATLHHAFDAGLFQVDEDGKVSPSISLTEAEKALLGIRDGAALPQQVLTPRRKEYLRQRLSLGAC